MSSVISTEIGPQSFEIVRDRIGRILAEELENQYKLTLNPLLKVSNWIERFLPFDNTELPSVNVMLAEGTYDGQTAIQTDGTYRYYIDVFVNAKTKPGDAGDQKAMRGLHKIIGICRAIIQDARYKTLGFPTPSGFIMNRHFESIQIKEPKQKDNDLMSTAMGRLILSVKVPEVTSYIQPVSGQFMATTVKLESTERGYRWVRENAYDPYDFAYDV